MITSRLSRIANAKGACVLPLKTVGFCVTVVVAALGGMGVADVVANDVDVAKTSSVDPMQRLASLAGDVPTPIDSARAEQLRQHAIRFDHWFDQLAMFRDLKGPDEFMGRVRRLIAIKSQVDALLDQALVRRTRFAPLAPGPRRRAAVRAYLAATSALIDLSGRLHDRLYDAIDDVAYAVATSPERTDQLVDVLRQGGSAIGAAVMAGMLLGPQADGPARAEPFAVRTRARVLDLIAASGQPELLPVLAELADDPQTPPELVMAAAEAIRRTGLPQDPRPGRDGSLPPPAISAQRLREILSAAGSGPWLGDLARRRDRLLGWLDQRADGGIRDDRYRLGRIEVRPGDWLLMRNPSPYNLFTDLAPGLFTHVGVITVESGSDGIRRMVVVDIPEQGARMQAVTVDTFVQRTLHYLVLRHPDPAVGRVMGARARESIGQRTEFDLTFRTQRVQALQGQPLAGRKIHTYCAGLLLLCAQETGLDRTEFFPLPEYPAGGHTTRNLATLGLTFGKDFISPTGALFSPHLTMVGRRDPAYEPRREVQEAIYDHFAARLVQAELRPAPDLTQALRLKLAEAARTNPLLARAMAAAVGVDQDTDLVSAAKALAVVEALDQIARGSSDEFFLARAALTAEPDGELAQSGYTPQEIREMKVYRARHAELWQRWQASEISFRALRIRLVGFYIDQGKRRLDARFFRAP